MKKKRIKDNYRNNFPLKYFYRLITRSQMTLVLILLIIGGCNLKINKENSVLNENLIDSLQLQHFLKNNDSIEINGDFSLCESRFLTKITAKKTNDQVNIKIIEKTDYDTFEVVLKNYSTIQLETFLKKLKTPDSINTFGTFPFNIVYYKDTLFFPINEEETVLDYRMLIEELFPNHPRIIHEREIDEFLEKERIRIEKEELEVDNRAHELLDSILKADH